MNKPLSFFTTAIILFSGLSSVAQQKTDAAKVTAVSATGTKDTTKKIIPKTPVVLGQSQLQGGNITKANFDALLKKGIQPADGKGKVKEFVFGYKERNLYEDSVGNVMIMADYMSQFCPGDTLSTDLNSIYSRTKAGDTAYFDAIKVLQPDGKETKGKEMKFILK